MKKQILTLGMICAAAFALTNCDKQSTEPQRPTEGTPFEIIASTVDTKTANDDLHTKWAKDDAINVFHAVAGSTSGFGTNDKFTWTGTDNKFTGTLTEALEDGSYDWYALYPYDEKLTDPTGASKNRYIYIGDRSDMSQTQTGNDSKAHLIYDNSNKAGLRNCPLYAVAKNVPSSAIPTFTMHNLASVVAVKVTNTTDTDLTVSNVSFTAPEGTSIVGTYYINFTDNGDAIYNKGQYTGNVAKLTVNNGDAIAKNGSATFYLAIAPFTAASGSTLKISVNGYEKPLTMPKDVTFKAGQIKEVTFNYNKEEIPETGTEVGFNFGYTTTDTKTADWEITKDGVTLAWSKGTNSYGNVPSPNKEGSVRMYVSTTLTITAPSGTKITKVQFTATGSKYGANNLLYNGTALTGNDWELSTPDNPVELTAKANARFKSIVVTYE